MTVERLHENEVPISLDLARALVVDQFPEWCDEPLELVTAGSDSVLIRLGSDHALRLPRRVEAVPQIEKDVAWLPKLAPYLPLPIGGPVAVGEPTDAYPLPWAVYQWIEGASAVDAPPTDEMAAAEHLGAFVRALRTAPVTGGPLAGEQNWLRGVPLIERDAQVRESLAGIIALDEPFDVAVLTQLWAEACAVPLWNAEPAWLHGDLHNANILTNSGSLAGVIDFGALGMGDPAVDLMLGWTLLTPESRARFRECAEVDDDTWARGRGWALFQGAVIIPYYCETNPTLMAVARRALAQVLLDA